MARPKIEERELLNRLTSVFRRHGLEGASLTRLSEATGLGRASLYHRFPGGKSEMAEAVMDHVDTFFAEQVFAPLSGDDVPRDRLVSMCRSLRQFYDRGTESCVLDTLSIQCEDDALSRHVKSSALAWRDALAKLFRDVGYERGDARSLAIEVLIQIEGSLVLARSLDDPKVFLRALDALPEMLD